MKYESPEYWNSLIRMSLSRFFILHALNNNSLHGYEITKRVSSLTEGCCAPTEGSLYPVLKDLEKGGYVIGKKELANGRERKVYTITEKGKDAYEVALDSWTKVAKYILNNTNKE